MELVSISVNIPAGGLTVNGNIQAQGTSQGNRQLSPIAAQAGLLTTRTSDTAGIVTLGAAPISISEGDKVDVYWENGLRYQMTVSSVASDAVTLTGGAGAVLPALDTPVTVGVLSSKTMQAGSNTMMVLGDALQHLAIGSDRQSSVVFLDADGAVLAQVALPKNGGGVWPNGLGAANPLAGDTVASVAASFGDTAISANDGVDVNWTIT
jgi:hypothetical protein